MPFDQHSLKAVIAPRALLTTEALVSEIPEEKKDAGGGGHQHGGPGGMGGMY